MSNDRTTNIKLGSVLPFFSKDLAKDIMEMIPKQDLVIGGVMLSSEHYRPTISMVDGEGISMMD